MHGKKTRARVFGQLDEFLPPIGIVAVVPGDALHFLVVYKTVEAAHAMAFDKGDHVVFYVCQIVNSRTHDSSTRDIVSLFELRPLLSWSHPESRAGAMLHSN